jgi:hypothetical protein
VTSCYSWFNNPLVSVTLTFYRDQPSCLVECFTCWICITALLVLLLGFVLGTAPRVCQVNTPLPSYTPKPRPLLWEAHTLFQHMSLWEDTNHIQTIVTGVILWHHVNGYLSTPSTVPTAPCWGSNPTSLAC